MDWLLEKCIYCRPCDFERRNREIEHGDEQGMVLILIWNKEFELASRIGTYLEALLDSLVGW